MSVTVVKEKGVTVITMETDSESMLPPLCQILKNLCYSLMCCSVNRGLMQSNTISALGTIQIMGGLFNIGLEPGRTSQYHQDMTSLGAAYWLGGMFILTGIASLIANRLPSVCSLIFAVLMNIVGFIFAVVGIVLYAIDIADLHRWIRGSDVLLIALDVTVIVLLVLLLCACIRISVLIVKTLCNLRKEKGGRYDEIYQPLMKEVPLTSPGA